MNRCNLWAIIWNAFWIFINKLDIPFRKKLHMKLHVGYGSKIFWCCTNLDYDSIIRITGWIFMKFDNRIILVLVAVIGIYAIFLFISDFSIISEKISNFKINYLPLILFLVIASWCPVFIKWHFLLKNCEIDIPLTRSITVFL